MAARDWFRALQVPVLPVSVGPALVGSLLGARIGIAIDYLVMFTVVGSLLAVQVGANLHKGIVESADLRSEAARPRSAFVFDAGAVRRTGAPERTVRALMYACYATGVALGLAVVALTGDLRLLLLGGLGAFLAYSYSGPPLKLSYRGMGEVSTFFAFGPVTVLGAALAQDPSFFELERWVGWNHPRNHVTLAFVLASGFGAMAAMISFARYFPAAQEDRQKGKRTPVVRLGPGAASVVFLFLAFAGAFCFYLSAYGLGLPVPYDCWPTAAVSASIGLGYAGYLSAAAVLAAGAVGAAYLPRGGRACDRAVALTVLLHVALSAYAALDLGPFGEWLVCY